LLKEITMHHFLNRIAAAFATVFTIASVGVIAPSPASASTTASQALDIKPYAITMSVPNIETTIAWYERVLGFKLDQTKSYPEFKTRLAFLVREGFRVELIEDANAKPGVVRADAPAHTATHGYSQFMFQTRDLASIKRHMQAVNVPIHFEFENAELGIRIFFVRDPNQNLITFVQRI
jgi:methylmalonyl-CoA/ethylmalonyl-CoA epimerase